MVVSSHFRIVACIDGICIHPDFTFTLCIMYSELTCSVNYVELFLSTIIDNVVMRGKIKAVAAKDNIVAIKIKSSRMLLATGFLRKVFEIFESYQTPIDMVCTSEVGVSVSIDNDAHLSDIVNELKKYGTVTVDTNMCIICVVGDLDWSNLGFETLATDALKDIPVRMISYGGSNYNISFLIKEQDKKRALQNLSAQLFN